MTKAELAVCVAENTGISTQKAIGVTNEMFRVIAATLEQGEKVQIIGFGTFYAKELKEREGRNPHTGEKIKIPAHYVPGFKAGKQFKEQVQKALKQR